MAMITQADQFFIDGCGRCEHFASQECKARKWQLPLLHARQRLLTTGLEETCKWGAPVYTHQGKNVLILGVLKKGCSLSFVQGGSLEDPKQILAFQGPNSRLSKVFYFQDTEQWESHWEDLVELIEQAKELSKGNKPTNIEPVQDPVPELFLAQLDEDLSYRNAWEKLTPGRKRSYLMHFNGAKKESTLASRIVKCRAKILQGKGLNEY